MKTKVYKTILIDSIIYEKAELVAKAYETDVQNVVETILGEQLSHEEDALNE